MDKAGEANFLIQHVEKIVLAVCVCLLVFVLVQYVASSPRHRKGVAPEQIDKKLLDEARAKKDAYERQDPDSREVPDFLTLFEEARNGSFPVDKAIDLTPPARGFDLALPGDSPQIALADLLPIPKPEKPKFWAGWEVPSKEGTPEDVVACHVAAVYPWADLVQQWNAVLKNNPRIPVNLVVVTINAEIQQMNQDGTWTPAQPVEQARPMMFDEYGTYIGPPAIPPYDGIEVRPIRDTVALLAENQWQAMIVQPDYYDIWRPGDNVWGSWVSHLPKTKVHEIKPPEPVGPTWPTPVRPTPRPRGLDEERPAGRGDERRGRRGDDLSFEDRGRFRADERPGRRDRPRPAAAQPTRGSASQTGLPDLLSQKQAGIILVWLHDTSLVPMKAYRYRIQLELVNPLFTYDREVKDENKQDALTPSVRSPWSKWSDTVFVPNTNELYFTGQAPTLSGISGRVRVYAQTLGQRVRKSFTVGLGYRIGKLGSAKVVDLTTSQRISKEVNFDTGAYAIEFDFDKKVYVDNLPQPKTTAEMIYLDAGGQLRAKLLALDVDSDRQDQLIEQTRQAAPPPPTPKPRQPRRTIERRQGRSRDDRPGRSEERRGGGRERG